MDLGTLFGLIGTWILIVWAMLQGDTVSASTFLNPSGLIMVVGGSMTIIFLSFPAGYITRLGKILRNAFFHKPQSLDKLVQDMVAYAEIARRDGILSLENTTKDIEDPFIVRGIQMAVDGTDPELIEQILNTELENLVERHQTGKAVLDALGKYAPAFGMIGTLVGLVIMLSNLGDPGAIGTGMAVALLTTLYGSIIANAFALPIADRLARRSAEEVLFKTIIIKGVMAIQSGDNPRIVEQKLRTFLPPSSKPEVEEEAA